MTTHLSLQRMLLPTAQVSDLTTGSITLPSAPQPSIPPEEAWDYIAQSQPSGVTSVTFSSLPSGYSTFKIIGWANTSGDSITNVSVNGGGGTANFYEAGYYGSAGGNLSTAGTPSGNNNQMRRQAANYAGGGSVGQGAPITMTFFGVNSTGIYKAFHGLGGYSQGNLEFTFCYGVAGYGSALSSIKIATGNTSAGAGNFVSSTFYILYGMKES